VKRREFIAGLGSAAASPLVAQAQQPALPMVGFITLGSIEGYGRYLPAFRAGIAESGYIEGRNVGIEYQWLGTQTDRFSELVAQLIRRRPAVIVVPVHGALALAAKAMTATIPIVFGSPEDPVTLGLVASLARPGGNATGINFFTFEVTLKRLDLLAKLVPKAARIAVLANPTNGGSNETPLQQARDAARQIGVSIEVFNASTIREIEEVFEGLVRERIKVLYLNPDAFFTARMPQFATLAAKHGIATAYSLHEFPEVGGLMSYGTDLSDVFHQVGAYTGQILKGTKPADLPVVQSTQFEFVINLQTARLLGIDVPPQLLAIADKVIE
jgi:putative ABC transport system substrate-binding protein